MEIVSVIAINTFRESIRSKILYSLLFFAALLVLASAFFGSVSIGDQLKVIKDFGLFSISFLSVCFVVISGSSLLYKELARKTIYNILGKSVTRWQFLLGKFLGLVITAETMLILMGAALCLLVLLMSGEISSTFVLAFLFMGLELVIVCAAAILFSTIVVTPLLIGLFTFSLFLAGRSVSLLLYLIDHELVVGAGASVLKGVYYILPHLEALNISDQAVYNDPIALEQIGWAVLYVVGYSAVLLVIAQLVFARRDFN